MFHFIEAQICTSMIIDMLKYILFYLSGIVYSFVKHIVLNEVDLPFLLDGVQILELKGTQTGKCLTDSTDKDKKLECV